MLGNMRLGDLGQDKIDKYKDLDSTFNFRCNEQLKHDFNKVCKKQQTSSGSVIKQYMLLCVLRGEIV